MSTGEGSSGATGDSEPTDAELVAMLADALGETDPAPQPLLQFGSDSFALLRLETELASALLEVDDDSTETSRALVGLRGPAPTRFVTFAWTGGEVEIELGTDDVSGSVDGVEAVQVITRSRVGESLIVAVDDFGVFQFQTPSEPFRLEFVVGDVAVRTEWITPG